MKRVMAFILACLMISFCFVACNDKSNENNGEEGKTTTQNGGSTTPAPDATTTDPAATTLPPEPVDDSIKIFYDDRTTIAEILGKEVSSYELKDVVITSKVVGSIDADTALLTEDPASGKLVATAVGSATIVADGEEYKFKVVPAPLTVALIIGHSLGMGSQGNAAQSVKSEIGQVYGSQLSDALFKNVDATTGLGMNAPKRPSGIDALCDGTGRQGTDGAIGFEWNRISGEKIFVLNAAIGGSCVNQWTADQPYHINAVRLLNAALNLVKNEVTAGHYEYKTSVIVCFSTANFYYQNVLGNGKNELTSEEIKTWHDSVWNGFQTGITVDVDGDGKNDAPTAIGYNPLWEANAGGLDKFNYDKHAIYYMGASKEYPHIFIISHDSRSWQTLEGIKATFPEIDYETQKSPVKAPTTLKDVSADNVHLTQLGYNAQGQEIARNLYAYLTKQNAPKSALVFNTDGKSVNSLSVKAGGEVKFAVVANPVSASELEFTCTDNFEISADGVIKGISVGNGKLTISYNGETIKSITIRVVS